MFGLGAVGGAGIAFWQAELPSNLNLPAERIHAGTSRQEIEP
jgi:hypothetical protein